MSSNNQELFSKNLTRIMKEKGVSLKKLASSCDIPYSTLFSWSVGRQPSNLEYLRRIATQLEVEFYYLLFGREDPNSLKQTKDPRLVLDSLKIRLTKSTE